MLGTDKAGYVLTNVMSNMPEMVAIPTTAKMSCQERRTLMILRRRRSDGFIGEEELHMCILCTKMININKEKFLTLVKNGIKFYAHESCPHYKWTLL